MRRDGTSVCTFERSLNRTLFCAHYIVECFDDNFIYLFEFLQNELIRLKENEIVNTVIVFKSINRTQYSVHFFKN